MRMALFSAPMVGWEASSNSFLYSVPGGRVNEVDSLAVSRVMLASELVIMFTMQYCPVPKLYVGRHEAAYS